MLPFLLPALGFAKSWWKAIVGFIIAAPLFFLLGQCDGKKIGRQQMQTAIAKANVDFLQQKARADELAANQRITDTIAVNRQEQELLNVIAQTPDSLPDAARIALGCERLRRAHGANPASLPAECRSGGGSQAGSAR